MNWIPGVSQVKSVFQLVCGDVEGAAKTQLDFLQECPIVSQATSAVQLISGNPSGALETQIKCAKMLSRTADGVPVVGHAKGVVHYACGDTKGGNRAFKSATRTTSTMAAGAGGFLLGGPVGAVAGGIAGGAAFDSAFTVADSIKYDEFRPSGYFAAVTNIIKNPNSGDIFDTLLMPVGDGMSGYSGGRLMSKFKSAASNSSGASSTSGGKPPTADAMAKANTLEMQADAILEAAEAGKDNMPSGEYLRMSNEAKSLWDQAQNIKGEVSSPVDLKAPVASAELNASTEVIVPTETVDLPPSINSLPREPVTPTNNDQKDVTAFPQLIQLWMVWETDTIPIVGANKWEAELVSAYLHLDIPKIKQICKEENLETIFDELDVLTHAKVAQTMLETGAIKGVAKENTLKELLKLCGRKGKQAVKNYLTIWKERSDNSKDEGKRSLRGEHIINNGVLKLHRDIMEFFLHKSGITDKGIDALRNGSDSKMLRDCENYFAVQIVTDIQDTLKAHFDVKETYIDANALIYGKSIQVVKEMAVLHMLEVYKDDKHQGPHKGSKYAQTFHRAIDLINKQLLYVDKNALRKWLQERDADKEVYIRARDEVYRMFEVLYRTLGDWAIECRHRQWNN